jgi:hypothetical protein
VRFYYVLFLANETDIWFYMADSLNWCSIEIYAGKVPSRFVRTGFEPNIFSAIICSSASTFKAILKTYLPKVWGSYGSQGPSGNPRHQYDQSRSGQFVMKPFGASSSNKSNSNRKYGISDLTEIGNDSEEAIVRSEDAATSKKEISGAERQH